MTTISQSAAPVATHSMLARVLRPLGLWACAAAAHWERRAATKTLHEMTDRELRDIGLDRGQIERAVRKDFRPDIGGL